MFWKKNICNHDYVFLGIFYKEIFSEYKNSFDTVTTVKREKCKLCGEIHDVKLTSEYFLPQLYKGREKRRDDYIEHLKELEIAPEIDIALRKKNVLQK